MTPRFAADASEGLADIGFHARYVLERRVQERFHMASVQAISSATIRRPANDAIGLSPTHLSSATAAPCRKSPNPAPCPRSRASHMTTELPRASMPAGHFALSLSFLDAAGAPASHLSDCGLERLFRTGALATV